MLKEHMNFNVKDWEENIWINSHNCRLFNRKMYFCNPYCNVFRNMYFEYRVAVPPKCFIFK